MIELFVTSLKMRNVESKSMHVKHGHSGDTFLNCWKYFNFNVFL